MADEFVINTRDLARFGRTLREKLPKEINTALNRELRAAGEIVAAAARAEASWSSRIPATIKVRRNGLRVKVVAGGANAPHARPYDHGGDPGSFRHPVYGNRDVWVDETARPFLEPALARTQAAAVAAVESAIQRALDRL